ncbi:MAG: zf-HC2 domain-containing protein [Nitrospinota bacterium]
MFFKNDCNSLNKYISALLDGELSNRQADKVRNHIIECKRCKGEFEILKVLKPFIRKSIKINNAPYYLREKIIRSIEEREYKKGFGERLFPLTWRYVYTTSAFAILFLLAVIPIYYLSNSVSASPIVVKSVNNHLNNTIVDIFDGQIPSDLVELERVFDVPGLLWQGICSTKVNLHYLKERKLAYICFYRKGHKISVFIFEMNKLRLPEGRMIKEGEKEIFVDAFKGFNVLFWKEGNTGYTMVSDLAGDEMIYFLKYGEGYINQIQKHIELGTFFE